MDFPLARVPVRPIRSIFLGWIGVGVLGLRLGLECWGGDWGWSVGVGVLGWAEGKKEGGRRERK